MYEGGYSRILIEHYYIYATYNVYMYVYTVHGAHRIAYGPNRENIIIIILSMCMCAAAVVHTYTSTSPCVRLGTLREEKSKTCVAYI